MKEDSSARIEETKAALVAGLREFAANCRKRKSEALKLFRTLGKAHKADIRRINKLEDAFVDAIDPEKEIFLRADNPDNREGYDQSALVDWNPGDVLEDGADLLDALPDGDLDTALENVETADQEAESYYADKALEEEEEDEEPDDDEEP